MKSFSSFISEAKRTKIRPDSKTGDEDGVNTKNDSVGTVSITDDTVPDSWNNSPSKRVRAVKDLMKLNRSHGAVEMPHSSIKEEDINELSPELVGKVNKARLEKPSKTPAAAQALSNAVKKAWLKSKVGIQKEGIVSTMGAVRSTPVTMSSTPRNKAKNAPSSAATLQRTADARRQKLDTFAQKQKDLQTKNRETELKSRQQKSKQNASDS